jgi:hypothetical protein
MSLTRGWEKLFTSYISDKGNISKMYKELPKVKIRKQTTQ